MPTSEQRVIVVGAGVVGLTCAVRLLEAGHRVDVVARDLPLETTSAIAAAVWSPYAKPQEHVVRWARSAYDVFATLCEDESSGVVMRTGTELFREAGGDVWWRDALPPGAGPDQETSLPSGYASGLTMRTPVVEMPVYLRWLAARVEALGGTITRMNLSALPDTDAMVVNASGIGSRLLGADHTVAPVRGQVVLVEQVGLDHWWIESETPTYIVPRSRDVVLGGTAIEAEWSRTPDPATARTILERAARIEPRLAGARVLRHKVGLRPSRATVRLEREDDVIHCYGHGGCGVTVSWGCADDVVELARG
ncbi:amino acid oxidase [Nocardioides sp. Root122]|uniref:FAD-dependent oxidoreductase n=1 Tax=Nocardioides TaxID=1839 RepID=UPI0007030427|nr:MULTISPECIES: FAD-dependent oxidoreductase [Nocardioides]KQV67634.1 amino acid oxidase [Nocardioides sp. Root122]MCK9824148.1 FAD-binding oxidoreductase [Nocardioides cavernae]